MKVLFAASEIYPYAKSGGLADSIDALSEALKDECDVARVMPLYGFMQTKGMEHFEHQKIVFSDMSYDIEVLQIKQKRMTTYFIKAPFLSDTKHLYGEEGHDYPDNDIRFGLFSAAVVELSKKLKIDVLHLNDWHTALCALFIKEQGLHVKSVFTIHNLAYQGVFAQENLKRLGLDEKYFTMEGIEFYSKINFLKAGIAYSDSVTTVSPTYAKEMMTQEFGCGLEGFMKKHKKKITGILNGINTKTFDPKIDEALFARYDAENLKTRHENKTHLQKQLKLKDSRRPLFAVVSRLVEQKGIDLLIDALKPMLQEKINLLILGEGSQEIVGSLEKAAKKYENLVYINGYDEALSRNVYASADFVLMPSRFEPCGLTQMIAMRYGAIPVVHAVGGLKDTVHEDEVCGQGIVFKKFNKKALLDAVARALELKSVQKRMTDIVQANMLCDYSFSKSAKEYHNIYKSLV